MEGFGARLKAAREARGVSLRQIAGATRISMTALEALERDDFSRLPGGIFSRAFIRAYAIEVGLDSEATVAEFLTELSRHERDAATESSVPEVTAEDRAFLERQKQARRLVRLGAALFVILVVVLGLWQGQRLLHEFWPSATSSAKAETQPVVTPQPTPAPAASDPGTPESAALRVEFRVTADCTVEVSADGQMMYSRDMRAGASHIVSAQQELQVQVGNAGAFVWTINGKPAKPLGNLGERRKATITKANFSEFLQ